MMEFLKVSSNLTQLLVAFFQFSRALANFALQTGRVFLHGTTFTRNQLGIMYRYGSLGAQCFGQLHMTSSETTRVGIAN